jgi:uncharacterized cofD-like protein
MANHSENLLARLLNHSSLKWLHVGLGVKRWFLLLLIGITIIALGLALILLNVYRESSQSDLFYYITLQFIPRLARGVLVGFIGIVLVLLSLYKLNQSILSPFVASDTNIVEALYRKRARQRGPKIVAMGGGTGLSTLLRGLKEHTDFLTAIVSVADDGGSSGKLRRELGVLPPGDLRQSIAALADSEPLMASLLQYRFGVGSGLEGHSFGNLFIAAMAGVTGNFERGLLESSRVLAVRGTILPATLANVTLCADTREPALTRVAGESEITHRGRSIERVYLEPEHVPAYPGVVRAILEADLLIVGPGSLYTSVLPNLLVEEIQQALVASDAMKVYVCNIATQPGETDGFTVEDHFDTIVRHTHANIFRWVVANANWNVNFPEHSASKMVRYGSSAKDYHLVSADFVDEEMPWRHDPHKLAGEILKLYHAQSQ